MKRTVLFISGLLLALCFSNAQARVCFLPIPELCDLSIGEQHDGGGQVLDPCEAYTQSCDLEAEGYNCEHCPSDSSKCKCEAQTCEQGYSADVTSCPDGYELETKGKEKGKDCGKCVALECPTETSTSPKCSQAGYMAVETEYFSGDLVCYQCVSDICPQGTKKDCAVGEVKTKAGKTPYGTQCYTCCNNKCAVGGLEDEITCNATDEEFKTATGEKTACGNTCYKCVSDKCPPNTYKTCAATDTKTKAGETQKGTQCYTCTPCSNTCASGEVNKTCDPETEERVETGKTACGNTCYRCQKTGPCADGPYSWRDTECCALEEWKNQPICQKPECLISAGGKRFTLPFKAGYKYYPTSNQCMDKNFIDALGLYHESGSVSCAADEVTARIRYCGSAKDMVGIDDLNVLANAMFKTSDGKPITNNFNSDWYQRAVPVYHRNLSAKDQTLVDLMRSYRLIADEKINENGGYDYTWITVRERHADWDTGAMHLDFSKDNKIYSYEVEGMGIRNTNMARGWGICLCSDDDETNLAGNSTCSDNPYAQIVANCWYGYDDTKFDCRFIVLYSKDNSKYTFVVEHNTGTLQLKPDQEKPYNGDFSGVKNCKVYHDGKAIWTSSKPSECIYLNARLGNKCDLK